MKGFSFQCIVFAGLTIMTSTLSLARAGHHPHKATLHHAIEKVDHAQRWCDKRASDGSWDLDLEDAGE